MIHKTVNSVFLVALGVAIGRPEFLIYLLVSLGFVLFLTYKPSEKKEDYKIEQVQPPEPEIKAYPEGVLRRMQNLKQFR